MGKMATCLTPGIRDFGHWFWKISRDAHNLQPNGLIKKKKKAVAIFHLGTTMWLTKNFQQSGKQDSFRHIMKSSSRMYESLD